jgi:hypothetical protein
MSVVDGVSRLSEIATHRPGHEVFGNLPLD